MLRHIRYTAAERKLAGIARQKAGNQDVLYHGTRYAKSILQTRALFRSPCGDPRVCLTRSADVAAYWASVERDDDVGRGSIFIFDRNSLERRYKIEANPNVWWHSKTLFHDEAEEEIWTDVINIGNHLIGIARGPIARRSQRHKALTRKHLELIEARLLLNSARSFRRMRRSP